MSAPPIPTTSDPCRLSGGRPIWRDGQFIGVHSAFTGETTYWQSMTHEELCFWVPGFAEANPVATSEAA